MGLPGASEGQEMSVALNHDKQNHSPVIASENVTDEGGVGGGVKSSKLNGTVGVGESNHNNNDVNRKNGETEAMKCEPVNGHQEEEVDVTSISQSTDDDADKEDTHVKTESEDAGITTRPEPDVTARLKRLRTHVLNPLFKHPKSNPFRQPVDAKALGIYPIYHQIITKPMDLGTIRQKIDRGKYLSRAQCIEDVELVWSNARAFNAPGHFVHEAANILEKVTKEKLAKLERDEAAGLLDSKVGKNASSSSKSPIPNRVRRPVRKVSQDFMLPGESSQPQQLKKKYVENLSFALRQCDEILKELMTVQLHRRYVEPFLHLRRKFASEGIKRGPNEEEVLDLYQIQHRLQSEQYKHPLQFGNDVRRMITDTYRHFSPKDPIISQASDLHHHFELRFARVDYEPIANPSLLAGKFTVEEDYMLSQLIDVQTQVLAIENNVTELLKDLAKLRRRDTSRVGANGTRKRKRVAQSSVAKSSVNPNPRRRRKVSPSPLSADESIALRGEVAKLSELQQQQIVQIMLDNKETLTTDDNGYTEIDLGSCSAKTVRQIQDYIKTVRADAQTIGMTANHNESDSTKKSPTKNKRAREQPQNLQGRTINLSDSSSSDDGDSSSSSGSSSTDSDSD